MNLPADRGNLVTEQRHQDSLELDTLDTGACIDLLVADHAAVCGAVAGAQRQALGCFIDNLVPRARRGGRLIYLGAGTSGRLGVLDAAECPPTFHADPHQVVGIIAGGDGALRRSSEGREDEPDGAVAALDELAVNDLDTVLGIAAGGTTPYVLGGLRRASEFGALTGLLTCAAMDGPPPGCDHLITLDTGPELLTGSTRLKGGSATKLALNVISTTMFVQLGKVYSNLMVDLRATNQKLRDRAIRILITLCPELDRPTAARRLDSAGGELKTAIVMERRGIDAAAARALLAGHGGRMREVVGGEKSTKHRAQSTK